MVYGQFSLYKQNILAGCFHLSLFTVKDLCTIAANTLLVNRTNQTYAWNSNIFT